MSRFGPRYFLIYLSLAAILVSAARSATAYGQELSITGPLLGFAVDTAGTGISPIWGVPGASVLGQQLDLGVEIKTAIISPEQNYALAVRSSDARMVVLNLSESPPSVAELPELHAEETRMAISPRGTAAAFIGSGSLRTFRGLPYSPEVVYQFDTSHLPGTPASVGVSDDGDVVVTTLLDGAGNVTAWVSTSNGALWQLPQPHVSSVAFLPGRYDAIVADAVTQEVFLLIGLGGTTGRVPLFQSNLPAGSPLSVASSRDGSFFVVSSESSELTLVDAQTHTSTVVECSCSPTGVRLLRENGVFLLNRLPSDLLYVLDVSSEPRVVVVPAELTPARLEPESSEQPSEQ
jgi:hypothetical protein